MPLVKTIRRRKSYAKKNAKVSDAVKKYVRKTINKAPELKKYFFGVAQSMLCDIPYTFNLPYQAGLAAGADAENELVGAKYRVKRMVVRGQVTNYQSTFPSETTTARIFLIKSPKFETTASLLYSELFISGGAQSTTAIPDNQQITVLADTTVSLQTQIAASNAVAPFEIDVPTNFIHEFADIANSYVGKNTNLYLVVCMSNVTGTSASSTAGGITCRTCVWFTDS